MALNQQPKAIRGEQTCRVGTCQNCGMPNSFISPYTVVCLICDYVLSTNYAAFVERAKLNPKNETRKEKK